TPTPEHVVPSGTGSWATPVFGSQLSLVQPLRSFTSGGSPATQLPEPLHDSSPLHRSPSGQEVPPGAEVPARQVPAPSHCSAPLHTLPSSHDEPAAVGVLRQRPTVVPPPTQT